MVAPAAGQAAGPQRVQVLVPVLHQAVLLPAAAAAARAAAQMAALTQQRLLRLQLVQWAAGLAQQQVLALRVLVLQN